MSEKPSTATKKKKARKEKLNPLKFLKVCFRHVSEDTVLLKEESLKRKIIKLKRSCVQTDFFLTSLFHLAFSAGNFLISMKKKRTGYSLSA